MYWKNAEVEEEILLEENPTPSKRKLLQEIGKNNFPRENSAGTVKKIFWEKILHKTKEIFVRKFCREHEEEKIFREKVLQEA